VFNLFKKKSDKKINLEALLTIPCDYDGYDFTADPNKTNPYLYEQITNIITNSNLDIKSMPSYKELTTGDSEEDFDSFYDEWISRLSDTENSFICYLDNSVTISDFAEGINNVLKSKGFSDNIDSNKAKEIYYNELREINIDIDVNYGVLIANVVARLLREIQLELIVLFDGFDNKDFTVIPIELVSELKEIESKLK